MIRNGSDLMLFANGKSIGAATSCKININAETTDASNKDEGNGGWTTPSVKKLNFEASSENFFLDTAKGNNFDDLFDLMIAKTVIDIVFSLDKIAAEKELPEAPANGWTLPSAGLYRGKAIITSLDANAPSGDNATYSTQFKGVGKLERVDPV